MLIIGNSNLVDTNTHGEGHWIFQLADHYKETPEIFITDSNESTYNKFLNNYKKHKQVVVTVPNLVHQKIGNFVYNWDNDQYLDTNYTRRRDMLLLSHTPKTLVNHNKTFIDSIKLLKKDVKIASEWGQIRPCVAEKLLGTTTTPYYSKYSISDQFIRWCEIHNTDISKHTELDSLIQTSEYYNSDYTYTQAGHDAILDILTTK